RSPRRHDAVMARRRRDAHERDARVEGGTLRHVDRAPAADPEGELERPLPDPLLALADLLPRRVGDDELGDAHLAGREFLLDRLARDLQRVLVGDEQGLLPQLQGLADLADLVERVVPDDDVPRELHRFGLVEDLGIQGADGRRLRSASKGVSVLNSDDPSCQIPSDGSHRRASPRNLYGRSFLMRGSMVFPLAVAMAMVLARLGRAKPALQAYEALVRSDAANAVAWSKRGEFLEELNKIEEAVAAYQAATAADPTDADAWTGLGDSLYALERYEEAVEAYDRAIAADPDNEEAWNNKGFTFFMLGIHDEALACSAKSLSINPTYKQ